MNNASNKILHSRTNIIDRQIVWQILKCRTSFISKHDHQKCLKKINKAFNCDSTWFQFHEMFQPKCICSSISINSYFLFYNICVIKRSWDCLRSHYYRDANENKVMISTRPLQQRYYCNYSFCFYFSIRRATFAG